MVRETLAPAMGQPPAQHAREDVQEETQVRRGLHVLTAMLGVYEELVIVSPGSR